MAPRKNISKALETLAELGAIDLRQRVERGEVPRGAARNDSLRL